MSRCAISYGYCQGYCPIVAAVFNAGTPTLDFRFAGNVLIAALMACMCSVQFVDVEQEEEKHEIFTMVNSLLKFD